MLCTIILQLKGRRHTDIKYFAPSHTQLVRGRAGFELKILVQIAHEVKSP